MSNLNTENYYLPVEQVSTYIYLGHKIAFGRDNQTTEVERRTAQAWEAFGKLNTTFLRQIS